MNDLLEVLIKAREISSPHRIITLPEFTHEMSEAWNAFVGTVKNTNPESLKSVFHTAKLPDLQRLAQWSHLQLDIETFDAFEFFLIICNQLTLEKPDVLSIIPRGETKGISGTFLTSLSYRYKVYMFSHASFIAVSRLTVRNHAVKFYGETIRDALNETISTLDTLKGACHSPLKEGDPVTLSGAGIERFIFCECDDTSPKPWSKCTVALVDNNGKLIYHEARRSEIIPMSRNKLSDANALGQSILDNLEL